MRRVTLSGVPVHPALVHFPVAFWICMPGGKASNLSLGVDLAR